MGISILSLYYFLWFDPIASCAYLGCDVCIFVRNVENKGFIVGDTIPGVSSVYYLWEMGASFFLVKN